MKRWMGLMIGIVSCAVSAQSTLYLPVQLSPVIERDVERLMGLANIPIIKRPIAVVRVEEALTKGCDRDPELCTRVNHWLERYRQPLSLTHASVGVAIDDNSAMVIPNGRGRTTDEHLTYSAAGHWRMHDNLLLSVGAVGSEESAVAEGSYLSFGGEALQFDIGYKPHWFSPLSDSAMLQSTQAPTYASVSMSNSVPLTFVGFHYELFLGELSYSEKIRYQEGYTEGRPKLAGIHLAFEPFDGVAFGANRLMQFGGGARGGNSLSDIFNAFFRPWENDNNGEHLTVDEEFGNQVASFFTRIHFDAEIPFSVYLEYAGEDTVRGIDYKLGNVALSGGIDFPLLWKQFTARYEFSQWQNAWYVHHIYQDGLTNKGTVLGHWGGEMREDNDGVGASSHQLDLEWLPQSGERYRLSYATLANEDYSAVQYHRAHLLTLSSWWPVDEVFLGGQLYLGRDLFASEFIQASVSLTW